MINSLENSVNRSVSTLSKSEAVSSEAMVVTKHPLATQAGLEVLRAGGNAMDAAIASCFATGVVEANSATIGGGGYIVYQMGDSGGVIGGHMPASMQCAPDMFKLTGKESTGSIGFGWAEVEGNANLEGHLSINVPGVVSAMCESHKLFGSMPLTDVLAPAIKLAKDGFSPHWHNLYAFGLLADMLFKYEELGRIFMPNGTMPLGDKTYPALLKQPDLAQTMEYIAKEGSKGFYEGDIAASIVTDIKKNGGVVSREDFSTYKPFIWDKGLEVPYRDTIVRVPPHATAGITTAMTLKLMDQFDFKNAEHNSASALHTYISAARLAYADRYEYLGDPETIDIPWKGLLSEEYSERRFKEIKELVPENWKPGNPWVEEGREPLTKFAASTPILDDGTTHICVIDKDSNAVSFTNTVGSGFGSGIVPKGTGIVMNNGMSWFDPIPGRINSIMPGRWPLNNAVPALVLNSSGVLMSVGVTGGRRITNAVTQIISNVIDFGMGPQTAIDCPRVDCSSPFTSVSPELDENVRSQLEQRGHKLRVMGSAYPVTGFANFGSPVAIVRSNTGQLSGGADTFHSAYAEGI